MADSEKMELKQRVNEDLRALKRKRRLSQNSENCVDLAKFMQEDFEDSQISESSLNGENKSTNKDEDIKGIQIEKTSEQDEISTIR